MKNKENVAESTEVTVEKPKIVSRIISVIMLVILSLLAVGIIACAIVPKNYNINLNSPDRIVIYTDDDSSDQSTYYAGSDEYKKIISLYNDSFKTSLMGSLFQGKLTASAKIVEGYVSLSSIDKVYIEFVYDESQKVTLNGTEYKASIISDTSYRSIFIEVNSSSSLTEVNAYVRYKDTQENSYSYLRYSTYAAQADLYDYITSL